MIEIVNVEPDLVQLRTRRRGWPSSCNVYLIRDGKRSVLIDSGLGVDPSLGELLAAMGTALAEWGQSHRDVHTILLTHTHTDHAGGAVPIARITGARIMLPVRGWAQAADPWWQVHHILPPEVRAELTTDYRNFDVVADHFHRETMPDLFSADADIVWQLVEDNEEIRIGRYLLKAYHMPGHDVAHLALVDLQRRLAFTGDLLTARGTSLPWYPGNAGGISGYLASLQQLSLLALETVCPGHNSVQRGAAVIAELNRSTQHMVLERDRQILTALLSGAKTFAFLDNLVYEEAVRAVIPWASSVTMAHLIRLNQTGLVSRLENGLFLTEPIAAERYLRTLQIQME